MMRAVLRLAVALFLMQAGFHGYTASLPVALSRAGASDAEIGLIVGTAALIQIPAALLAGALIDAFGGIRLFLAGGLAYVAASLLLLVPVADPGASPWLFVAARLLQGTGIGFALPAALSVVPTLASAARQGLAIAAGGLSHNLTLVVVPPLSLIVLDAYGLPGVAVFVLGSVAVAFGLTLARPFARAGASASPQSAGSSRGRFRFAFRNDWLAPLAITLLYSAHWGLVVAYLPQRAVAAGADIGLFFAADGLGVLLARLPTVALSRRSTDADRGAAFALFSAVFAVALAIGSVGTAAVIDTLGFDLTLSLLLAALLLSGAVALIDRGLGSVLPGVGELADIELAALPPAS